MYSTLWYDHKFEDIDHPLIGDLYNLQVYAPFQLFSGQK